LLAFGSVFEPVAVACVSLAKDTGSAVNKVIGRVPQVCRGTAVTMVSPTTGAEEIANPFLAAEEQQ
jgi:hypothetical protein